MKRFIVNTGEFVDLTPEEVAEHEALAEEAALHEKTINDAKAAKELNKASGRAKLKELGLTDAEVEALTS